MTTPAWPASVPQGGSLNNYNEEDQDSTLEFPVEVGLPRRRARTTLVTPLITYDSVMTWTQWDALLVFYRTDCKRGTLEFTRDHPRTAAAITCTFASKPKAAVIDNSYCRVAIALTLIPQN